MNERMIKKLKKKYGWRLPRTIDAAGLAILLEQEKEVERKKKAKYAALKEKYGRG